jgi:hypothetical protein
MMIRQGRRVLASLYAQEEAAAVIGDRPSAEAWADIAFSRGGTLPLRERVGGRHGAGEGLLVIPLQLPCIPL